jgi:RND superfamily putative drug exporter
MERLLERVTKAVPDVRTASFGTTRDTDFVATDGRTTFALVFVSGSGGGIDAGEEARVEVRDAVRDQQVAGAPVLVTGLAALRAGDSGGGGDSSALVETLIGAVVALAVLSFVFASLLAFVPLLMALAAIPVTFMLVWAITTVTDVSFVVTFLVALVGLGVAIDYALLVVMRWREERDRGQDNETAVRTAMRTAGTSVVFSGSTVAIGLVALVALPVPFLRSVGYGGALIPLVSVLVAVTFLPVVLRQRRARPARPDRLRVATDRASGAVGGRVVRRRGRPRSRRCSCSAR